MSFNFSPHHHLVVVQAELEGPAKTVVVSLALDTGSSSTMIKPGKLVAAGIDPSTSGKLVQFTTGLGLATAPVVIARRMTALGTTRRLFPILAFKLPPSAGVDGMLGLDFLRGLKLEIDFRAATIDLS
jgi:hypothetical protein